MTEENNTFQASAGLLLSALGGQRPAASALAQAWGATDDPAWSAIDVIIQNRLSAAVRGDESLRKSIDASVAQAWRQAAAACGQLAAGSEALQSMRGLALLTERIPSPDIHGGLFAAIFEVKAQLKLAPEPEVLRRRLAPVLVSAWVKTLDKASRTQMVEVMKGQPLFAPLDYFTGFAWAWRFGIHRAADYVGAVAESLPERAALPLPSEAECERFAQDIAMSLPALADAAYLALVGTIFQRLRDGPAALGGWLSWLGTVFAKLQQVHWLMEDGLPNRGMPQAAAKRPVPHAGAWAAEVEDPMSVSS